MRRRRLAFVLLLGLVSWLAGCRLHLDYVIDNPSPALGLFDTITLGEDDRRAVLARLGPPDAILYAPEIFVFDYTAGEHRGTQLEIFLPSEIVPGFDPLAIFAVPRFLFDPSGAPEVFEPSTFERLGRGGAGAIASMVPFVGGEELVTVMGHQVRGDRLRLVFERETRTVTAKSLRLASGDYRQETLPERVFLQAD